MKILQVIYSLETGGAEKLIVDIVPRLAALGDQVNVLIFQDGDTAFKKKLLEKNIRVFSLNTTQIYSIGIILKLRKFLKNYDIIHTHTAPAQIQVPFAMMLKRQKCMLVNTEHNTNNRRRNIRILYPLDRFIYSRYKKIICISGRAKENLVAYLHRDDTFVQDRIVTIYNGIDYNRFAYSPIRRRPGDKFIVTMVASMRAAKDQDTVIRAMSLLPEHYVFRMVGDGARREFLQDLVVKLSLQGRVEFLGIRNDIPQLLAESDVNILSSHWEGLSLSSIEGMAAGRPFIASDVDGLHEVVKDAGVLFPEGNAEVLAEKLVALHDNETLYIDIARKCRERAQEYDIGIMVQKYHNLYHSL